MSNKKTQHANQDLFVVLRLFHGLVIHNVGIYFTALKNIVPSRHSLHDYKFIQKHYTV